MKAIWLVLAALCLSACASNGGAGVSEQSGQALEGSWRLSEIEAQSVPMVGSNTKVLRFNAGESKFTGNMGCNRMFGLYTQTGEQLSFNGIATTRMACDPVSMQFENKVINRMETVQTWQVYGDELRLLDGSKNTVLKLKRM